jgi:hypothetical protein
MQTQLVQRLAPGGDSAKAEKKLAIAEAATIDH